MPGVDVPGGRGGGVGGLVKIIHIPLSMVVALFSAMKKGLDGGGGGAGVVKPLPPPPPTTKKKNPTFTTECCKQTAAKDIHI